MVEWLKNDELLADPYTMKLSSEQIASFHHDGLIVLPNLFTANELVKVRTCIDRLLAKASQFRQPTLSNNTQFVVEGEQIRRIVWALGNEPILREIAQNKKLTGPASQLLGSSEIIHIISQIHPKLPGDQVAFPWHQDAEHRKFGSPHWNDINQIGSYVQTLLAVDPINEANGPVIFLPGSNRKGCLFLEKDPTQRKQFEHHANQKIATADPGGVIFFNPYVVHGSKPNTSNQSRYVFINGFAYPGANRFLYPGCGLGESISI